MAALGIDRGLFATWRCRGIGPAELPSTWFRPTTGSPRFYQVDAVLGWLAARRGEPFDRNEAYRSYLTGIGLPADLSWVQRFAEGAGPTIDDVRFTSQGWRAYLASLTESRDAPQQPPL
ncbi:hypothetical protein [Methylobacterium iners]|uniref:hypothetical protein n=1 Tax=Methylobacterium iners TaxID=418707 RepID=UPI001EE32110|nr:hypothetical protein [Methylobacterium iners]